MGSKLKMAAAYPFIKVFWPLGVFSACSGSCSTEGHQGIGWKITVGVAITFIKQVYYVFGGSLCPLLRSEC